MLSESVIGGAKKYAHENGRPNGWLFGRRVVDNVGQPGRGAEEPLIFSSIPVVP